MASDPVDFWLWVATVGTAVAGGALSILGTARQRKDTAAGMPQGPGYRMVMASYVLMTVSIFMFVIRGFI